MSTPVQLTEGMADVFKVLFPTLEWDRLSFYVGVKYPYGLGHQEGMALPAWNKTIQIYFSSDRFVPCSKEFMFTLYHELVHALQIYDSALDGKGAGLFHMFTFKFLTCWFDGGGGKDNKFEAEAQHYEAFFKTTVETVEQAVVNAGGRASNAWPTAYAQLAVCGPNPNFVGVDQWIAARPDIVRTRAEEGPPCKGGAGGLPLRFLERITGWNIGGDDVGRNTLGWAIGGAIGGAIAGGGPLGALAGAVAGALIGVIDQYTGIPSGLVALGLLVIATVLDLVIGLASELGSWLGFGKRPVKLVVSTDDGATFADAAVLGETAEPPAVALGLDRLFVSWKAPNDKVNVVCAIADRDPTILELGDCGDTGTAMAWREAHVPVTGQITVLWPPRDNKLVVRRSTDSVNFQPEMWFGGHVPHDGTPGLVASTWGGSDHLHAAWIRHNNSNRIGIKHSIDGGATWPYEGTLHNFTSHDNGTAALAFGHTNSCLYLAWAAGSDRQVRIATLYIAGDGSISSVHHVRALNAYCTGGSGPAIAFGNARLFVAWVASGKHVRVQTFYLDANGTPNDITEYGVYTSPGLARDNTSPALAYTPVAAAGPNPNTLVLAYVRRN